MRLTQAVICAGLFAAVLGDFVAIGAPASPEAEGGSRVSAQADGTDGRLDASQARIGFSELLNGGPPRLFAFAAFLPPAHARPATNVFQGRLTLRPRGPTFFRVHRDDHRNGDEKTVQILPEFEFTFVQYGDRIVPSVRGAVTGEHDMWEWILEPGKAWDEEGDQGFTRVGVPFALQERNENCTHYGALTFAFKSDGTITDAVYQIAGETCSYFKFDLAGIAVAAYRPAAVENARGIIASHQVELANRLKTVPIGELGRAWPGADASQFGSPKEVNPEDMTTFGFVVDGVHYTGGCETRAGAFPDCDVMPLPSYSTAKSVLAGLAAMRIELLHPGALQTNIASLVPQCASSRWGDVRMIDALNMATGNFDSDGVEVDERAKTIRAFFDAEDHEKKIRLACEAFPRSAAPGSTFVYHTVDTYILGTALSALWRAKHGPNSDFYREVLIEPVWRRLALSPVIREAKRTYDNVRQPLTGYGLTYHRDDVAKLAMFLNHEAGLPSGSRQMTFDRAMLRAALQHDAADRGLVVPDGQSRYRHGFWAWRATDFLGCAKETWIPFMSGYGGITVALMPNDTVYYYFSDGGAYSWTKAVAESNRIRKFC